MADQLRRHLEGKPSESGSKPATPRKSDINFKCILPRNAKQNEQKDEKKEEKKEDKKDEIKEEKKDEKKDDKKDEKKDEKKDDKKELDQKNVFLEKKANIEAQIRSNDVIAIVSYWCHSSINISFDIIVRF